MIFRRRMFKTIKRIAFTIHPFVSAGVVIQTYIANRLRLSKLTFTDQIIMSVAGLRGAIAFSLSVLLDSKTFGNKDLLITTTIVVIYFTNIVMVSERRLFLLYIWYINLPLETTTYVMPRWHCVTFRLHIVWFFVLISYQWRHTAFCFVCLSGIVKLNKKNFL